MNSSINICLVYPGYYPDDFAGGIATYLDEYLNMFKGKNGKVILISRTLNLKKTIINDKNIEIHRIPTDVNWFIKLINKFTKNKFRMLFYSINLYFYLKRIKNNKEIDLIEGCDWGAELYYTAKHNLNIPIIVRIHTPSFISEKYNPGNNSYLGNYTKKLERKLLNNENIIVVTPDNSIIGEFRKENVIPKNIIYNVCYPLSKIETNNAKFKELNIMFAGRLEERKGLDTIFYLMNQILIKYKISYIKFNFYGADTILKNGEKYRDILIQKYKLNNFVNKKIFFYGQVSRTQLLHNMKKMNIYISASKFELVGYSALEAIKSGNILIHSGTGFLRKFIRNNKEGYIFKNKDELVEIVLNIYSNNLDNIKNIRIKGINKVNEYTERTYLYNKTIKLYKKILNHKLT